ncbi:cyclic nucleotide-binding domain-containing protein [bacterium]|nr:cyclic nucleotide-binding domain-containing protein [bacterium]
MDVKEVLKKTYIFHTLEDDELELLVRSTRLETIPKGHLIFDEGDEGGPLYIIKSGRVSIKKTLNGGKKSKLAELGQYFFLGEISLFDGGKRSASVEAVEDTECVIIGKSDFWAAMMANPTSAHKVYRAILSVHSNAIRRANERFRDFLGSALGGV